MTVAPSLTPGEIVYTTPPKYKICTTETLNPGFDTTALLVGDDVPSEPSTVLWDQNTNSIVSLSDAPSISDNLVIQRMRGSELVAKHFYLQLITFTATVSGNVWTMGTGIYVPL